MNTFGRTIGLTIFGESHGLSIGAVLDGLPSGEAIDWDAVRAEMARRAPGKNKMSTARSEKDAFEVQSGFFNGHTTGTPLCAIIRNSDQHSRDYDQLRHIMRPGHADYSGKIRYGGFNDYRGGGHFSGRLTAPLVFAGAVASQILARHGITIGSHILRLAGIADKPFDAAGETAETLQALKKETLPVLDKAQAGPMEEKILEAKNDLDSVGGVIECMVTGLPAGIGDPFFDSVESQLSHMMFSVPAVEGIESATASADPPLRLPGQRRLLLRWRCRQDPDQPQRRHQRRHHQRRSKFRRPSDGVNQPEQKPRCSTRRKTATSSSRAATIPASSSAPSCRRAESGAAATIPRRLPVGERAVLVMDASEDMPLNIACFGQPGSYTYEAMKSYFAGKNILPAYGSHFEDVVQAVATRQARYGVLPIENSSTGGITDVYDLIHRYDCCVVGEKYVKVEHCLLTLPGTKLEDIREVYSHPQGLNQCRSYLKHHGEWQLHPYFSTSQSAEQVQKMEDPHIAAIANKTAADMYGLDVLVEHINDNTMNYTRFFIIAADMEQSPEADKITLVLTTQHRPGALYHVLGYFFYNGMNMTHLIAAPQGPAL